MTLTLSIRPPGIAGTPPPPPLTLDRRGAVIGRAAECDLVLPDPRNTISRRHCQIDWQPVGYVLTDTSTSGTTVNGQRLATPRTLAAGDVIGVGPYQLSVALGVAPAAPAPGRMNLDNWQSGPAAPPRPSPMPSATAAQTIAPGTGGDAVTQLLAAAGLARAAVPQADGAVLAAAGALLRQSLAGTTAMLAARTRARTELGLRGGSTDPANPLLAGAASEASLAKLLGSGPGAASTQLAAAQALLDAHQQATLKAMQGALRQTLDTLAPAAIRKRTKGGDAALWQAYEAAFAGAGSDASFIEVFARELGAAYEGLAGSKG